MSGGRRNASLPVRVLAVLVLVAAAGLAQSPKDELRGRVLALNEEGVKAYEEGRHDVAIARFEEARALLPEDPVLRRNLARALGARGAMAMKAGRALDAVADFERSLALDPKDPGTVARLGEVRKERGELEAARIVLERGLEAMSDSALLFESLGRLEYDDENLEKAVELLVTAAKLDPERGKVLAPLIEKIRREAEVEKGWFKDRSRVFTVKYDDQEFRAVGGEVLRLLDRLYHGLAVDFDVWPERRITVVLYTRGDFDSATGARDWAGGLFDGKIRLPVRNFRAAAAEIEATLAHELTHLFVRTLTSKCPLWLNEGLAQIKEGRVHPAGPDLRGERDAGTLPRVAALPAQWMGITERKTVDLYYALGLGFTRFLVENYGWRSVRDLLRETTAAGSFDAAFKTAFGRPLDEIEDLWRRSL